MKQVSFTNAPDDVETDFVLDIADRPHTPELLIVVDSGMALEPVASSPTGLQFSYDAGTGTVTTGYAPATGTRLFAYAQITTGKGMTLEEPLGAKNNSNTVFTLSTPLPDPTDSHPLVMQGRRVLEYVASAPDLGQYTFAEGDLTITLGAAPFDSNEHLLVGLEDELQFSAAFEPVALVGDKDGENVAFFTDLNADPLYTYQLLFWMAGVVQNQAAPTPNLGQFRYDDESQFVAFGTPAGATEGLWGFATQKVPRTDVDLTQTTWLRDPRQSRVLLITLYGKRESDGNEETFRFSTDKYSHRETNDYAVSGFILEPLEPSLSGPITLTDATLTYEEIELTFSEIETLLDDIRWEPFIKTVPSLSFSQQRTFFGRSHPAFGAAEFWNTRKRDTTGRFDTIFGLGGYTFDGRQVDIDMGGPNLPHEKRVPVMRALGGPHSCEEDLVTLPLKDLSRRLQRKTEHDMFTVGDYPNLPPALEGKPKPLAWGEIQNVRVNPYKISTADPVYLLCSHAIESVIEVRDNGVLLTVTTEYTVQPTATGGATLTLVSEPVGIVTVTFEAKQIDGTYSAKIADIVEDLVISHAGFVSDDIATADLEIFRILYPYDAQLYVPAPTTVESLLDKVLEGIPALYQIDRTGKFVLRPDRLAVGNPLENLSQLRHGKTPSNLTWFEPVWRVVIRYGQLQFTHDENDLEGVSVAPADQVKLATEWEEEPTQDNALHTLYPEAEEQSYDTALIAQEDAEELGAKHLQLYGRRQATVAVNLSILPLQVKLGDLVQYVDTRYGIQGNWRVIGQDIGFDFGTGRLSFITSQITLRQ